MGRDGGSGGGSGSKNRDRHIYDKDGMLIGKPSLCGGIMTTAAGYQKYGSHIGDSSNPYNKSYRTAMFESYDKKMADPSNGLHVDEMERRSLAAKFGAGLGVDLGDGTTPITAEQTDNFL